MSNEQTSKKRKSPGSVSGSVSPPSETSASGGREVEASKSDAVKYVEDHPMKVSRLVGPAHQQSGTASSSPRVQMSSEQASKKRKSPGTASPPSETMSASRREVEASKSDALKYVEDVKTKFGKKNPAVYKAFIDLMKQFKTGSIDTLELVDRITTLFKGYNNLILGLNIFLPKNYAIKLSDIHEKNGTAEVEESEEDAAQSSEVEKPNSAVQAETGSGGAKSEVRIEDAVQYIEKVKAVFGDRSLVYSNFVETMKQFKSRALDVPTVVQQITSLFRGCGSDYNDLVLGFNAFLNADNKIKLSDIEEINRAHARVHYAASNGTRPQHIDNNIGAGGGVHSMYNGRPAEIPYDPAMYNGYRTQRIQPPVIQPPIMQHIHPNGIYGMSNPGVVCVPPMMPVAPPPPCQPVDMQYDHAIRYVTTVKERCIDKPQVYESFLEVLKKYQRGQRGLKEVLIQISTLLADHPDLLRDFTGFLPVAVQNQAKEHMNKAATQSEQRLAKTVAPPIRSPRGV